MNNERFTQIFLGGKALANGDQTGTTINVDGLSTNGFVLEQNMTVEGSGVPAGTTITTVNSQTQIVLSQTASVLSNAVLTFARATPEIDAADYNGVDFFVRIAPHSDDAKGFAGYKGASDSNFIVAVGSTDYEVIVGASGHSGLFADVDNFYSATQPHRLLVRRSVLKTTKLT